MKGKGFRVGSLMIVLLPLLTIVGCGDPPLDRPSFDPSGSSAEALELCDANGDGQVDESEASAAPGLLSAFKAIDTNGDGALSADEISARIAFYRDSSASVSVATCRVLLKRKPLPNAEVTFEPEPFMGSAFQPVTSTTDETGLVTMSRPNVEQGAYPGVYLGLYRVKVSKQVDGKESIPAKYNTETTLGFEVGSEINYRNAPLLQLN